jgi:aminopeptidase N
MKNVLLISLICFSFAGFGQHDHPCAVSRMAAATMDRSATLSEYYISLTEEYDVNFYFLDLEIERTSNAVAGNAEIHVTSETAVLDTFLIELEEDLVITEIRLNDLTPMPFTRDGSAIIVPVSFGMGDAFFMSIDYSGSAAPGGGGPFGDDGMNNDYHGPTASDVTFSISVPFYAYEWFPCKQSLTDKADSSYVFITTDETNLAGSNGLLTDVVDLPGAKKRFEWKSSNPIAYYLISVAVAQYVEHTLMAETFGAPAPIPVQSYFWDYPAEMDDYEAGAAETVRFLEHFSELLGGYPFDNEKYGYTMAPIGGAMEHQTMTTTGFFSRRIISHELGHQWFGNHVTCATWTDMWLKEGLTSYMEDLAIEEFYPLEFDSYMINRHNIIKSEPGGSVHVEDTLDLSDIYDNRLTYTKGPAILHTLRFLINDDTVFFEVLKTYLNTHGGGSAYTTDFKEILETITGEDYTFFFDQWYFGEGYPIYSIDYSQLGTDVGIELSQTNAYWDGVDLFTNDVEIRLTGSGYSEVFTMSSVNAASTFHAFTFPVEIFAIEIDPNNWIINSNGTIIEGGAAAKLKKENGSIIPIIYPNPATNFLTVELGEDEVYPFEIYNPLGALQLKGEISNDKNQIDLSTLTTGSYILKINGTVQRFNKI